jgi:hypothetical protein
MNASDFFVSIHLGPPPLLVFTWMETDRDASELLAMMSIPRLFRMVMEAM